MTTAEPVTARGVEAPCAPPEPLTIRYARSADEPEVERLARAHPEGTVFHRPAWGLAVKRVFGHGPRDLVAVRGERLVGTLPVMLCRGLSRTRHLVSAPYGVYGGPLATEPEAKAALVDRARAMAAEERVGRLELRCHADPGLEGLVPSDQYVTFLKTLPADPAEVVTGMRKEERRLVRRARDKHGLELGEGAWFVSDLARLFTESKQRLGSPGLPLEWFRALLETLGEDAVIHLARREREVLAASLSFVDGEALRMYYIGTTDGANRAYSTTSFMIAGLQEWAIERGLRCFDLGRSRRDAGTVKFKSNQGFEPEPLHYRYALVRSRELPSFTPSNPRTELLRRAWARLPAWLCRRASGFLAKRLF